MSEAQLAAVRQQVEETKDEMFWVINKANHRGEKLDDLENRALMLGEQANLFTKVTVKVKQKEERRWKKWEMGIAAVATAAVIILLIIILIYAI